MNQDVNINGSWELRGYIDADYTGDNDIHKSVSRYIVLINVSVVTWSFRSQKTVTLSVTEAKYSAITDVCCEILFIWAVLLFMGVVVKYHITVHVDNVGDILLSDNT